MEKDGSNIKRNSTSNTGFTQRRSHVLALLEKNARDKSRAGGVDAPIADLVVSLNSWPRIFTTSSCSGRVSVFAEPTAATRAAGHKGGDWVFVTHGLADAEALLAAVQSWCSNGAPLVFRFEPFILAAEAQTATDAQRLIRCARDAGYRESGVTGEESSRVITGIRCSIRLEVPVTDGQRLLVSHEYLCHLVKLANQKMEANWARVERFHALFRQQFLQHQLPGTINGGERLAPGGTAVEREQIANSAQSNGAPGEEEAVVAKPGCPVQKLQALYAQQSSILQRLQQLEVMRGGACAPVSPEGPMWRPAPLHTHGVPCEASRLWGHSMVSLGTKLVIFGGYGGAGAHKRLDDVLIYDCPTGIVQKLQCPGPGPGPRMGHAAAILSSSMLVHGGRTAPDQPLGDLWLLNLAKSNHNNSSRQCSVDEEGARWVRVDAEGTPPSPRHRHSAVSVGGSLKSGKIIIYGGMGVGLVLEDVWELRLHGKRWHWTQLACTGELPGPRHSHAAAIAGSSMYVYGGVRDCGQAITCDMHVLDLRDLTWRRIVTNKSSPRQLPPLFSHTLTALGRDRLVLIGGCPEQDTGDVYIFDLHSTSWHLLRAAVAGGAQPVPIRHCAAAMPAGDSAATKGDTLILIGGGAMCFSFGSTFSQPCTLHLPRNCLTASSSPEAAGVGYIEKATADSSASRAAQVEHADLSSEPVSFTDSTFSADASNGTEGSWIDVKWELHGEGADCRASRVGTVGIAAPVQRCEDSPSNQGRINWGCSISNEGSQDMHSRQQHAPSSNGSSTLEVEKASSGSTKESWALVVPKQEAKIYKDVLKHARGLNKGFYSLVCEGGASVALPMTEACVDAVLCHVSRKNDGLKFVDGEYLTEGQILLRRGNQGIQCNEERKFEQEQAVQFLADALPAGTASICCTDLVEARVKRSPREALVDASRDLLSAAGVSQRRAQQLMAEVPSKWERLGDLVLLPADSFRAAKWAALGSDLWTAVATALRANRVALQAPIANTGTRDSQVQLLRGNSGWVRHLEGGIVYSLNVTCCMFSSGNVTERTRMGKLHASGETVVDLFAGIGYYTLPLLVHAGVAKVVACEWNPAAVNALRRNLDLNHCANRCEILEGDCRQVAPQDVADRVMLGLLPSSSCGWRTALGALRPMTGGWLHLHHNVKDSEEAAWIASTQAELEGLSTEMGRSWRVLIRHVERVKWYAPHIRHIVLDVECRPEQAAASAPKQATSPTPEEATKLLPDQARSPILSEAIRLVLNHAASQGSHCNRGAVAEHFGITREKFERQISAKKEPAVLKGLDLGPAVTRWTCDYLKSLPCSATTLVSVHVCPDPTGRMDFLHKNFKFRTMPLAELVGRCQSPGAFPPLIAPGERYYLRSIGVNPRKEPSDIAAAFPELAADLHLPQLFPPDRSFSSVLRLSSEGLRLWTHFDVMDNLLCQVKGTKRVRLWPPLEELKLYMTGSSSEVTDIDDPDPVKYPLFAHAAHVDCILRPGDVMYIPALWHHNVLAEERSGLSVSVNVFWRDMERCMYAGKDLYGNQDPPAAEAAAAAVEAAAKALAQLPPYYRSFYGQRCARRLAESFGMVLFDRMTM